MADMNEGPRLQEPVFFEECLDLDYPGLEKVRERIEQARHNGNWELVKEEFADFVKSHADPGTFFDRPYHSPGYKVILPGEDEEAAVARIMKHTLVSVSVPMEYGEGKPIDWFANPTWNGYKEWTWQLSRHPELGMLCHQFRVTGNQAFADEAVALFESWVHQALAPVDEPDQATLCWRTIEAGIRTGGVWPYIFYTLVGNPAFTPQVICDWMRSNVEHGNRLYDSRTHGNWHIMEMNGLAHIGMIYPYLKDAGKWLNYALESMEKELSQQIYPDGFQIELTTNYHDVVVVNYKGLMEDAKALGYSLPDRLLKGMEEPLKLEGRLMMPNGLTPDINDGRKMDCRSLYRGRAAMAPDHPYVRWLGLGREEAQPKEKSMALEYAGIMVMRSGWGKDDAWALFDAGPFGSGHQHEDKLQVLFYAGGKYLLTDSGNYAYDDSEMRRYVLSTRAHNTVMINSMEQNRRKTYQWKEENLGIRSDMKYGIGEKWVWASGVYDEGYGEECEKAAKHSRFAALCLEKPGLLVVRDQIQSDKDVTADAIWHAASKVVEKKDGAVHFEDMDAVFTWADAGIVCGQEKPVWQGWLATGDVQGMYVPQNTLICHDSGRNLVRWSVFQPAAAGKARLVKCEALEDSGIRLEWSDGVIREYTMQAIRSDQ